MQRMPLHRDLPEIGILQQLWFIMILRILLKGLEQPVA